MARKKHRKQAEVRILPNVFHPKQENMAESCRGYFPGDSKFTLEIGCGNGEYTIALAQKFPDKCFIGVDRAGARIWNAATRAREEGVTNAGFILSYVEKIREVFTTPAVEEIIIPFPNPLPRRRDMKAMLIHPRFLQIYSSVMPESGKIHLKTDDDVLYRYALILCREYKLNLYYHHPDVHSGADMPDLLKAPTRFELHHLSEGRTIKYVCFGIPGGTDLSYKNRKMLMPEDGIQDVG